MRRFFAFLGIILITVLVVTAVTAGNASAAAASSSPVRVSTTMHRAALPVAPGQSTVILYGDSLASEAQGYFRDALAAAGVGNVRTSTFGGTAICDWLDRMRFDAAALHPTAVVVEFSGNALTPCMLDGRGQSLAVAVNAYYRKYMNDAREVLRIFATSGTRVYFASAPKTRVAEEANDANAGLLNTVYADLAAETPDASFVAAGTTLLQDGHWTATLPCLASEPCTGGVDAIGRRGQRRAGSRRRALLPRCSRSDAGRDRPVSGLVERRVPLRQRDGRRRHPRPARRRPSRPRCCDLMSRSPAGGRRSDRHAPLRSA